MNIKKIISFFLFTLLLQIPQLVRAQVSIGGIINRYYPVTAFTPSSGPCAAPSTQTSMTVGSGYGAPTPALAVGMRVLIIQMQAGASGSANRTTNSVFLSP